MTPRKSMMTMEQAQQLVELARRMLPTTLAEHALLTLAEAYDDQRDHLNASVHGYEDRLADLQQEYGRQIAALEKRIYDLQKQVTDVRGRKTW